MTQTNSTLYTIIPQVDDPYSQVIAEFFAREFPNSLTNATSLLELLTQAFVSTSQIRYGPAPKPESLVEIRKVISRAIELGRPIPVLIPWGGRKAIVERGIDIAEVVALKQLECLQSRVTRHYPAGIDARIRVEDTGALYLYQEDGYRGENAVEDYSSAFQRLVRILNLPFINPIRESSLMATDEYFGLSDQIAQPMFDYLVESAQVGFQPESAAWLRLKNLGWQGQIPLEQREYYFRRYRANSEGLSQFEATRMLAAYFAGSLARYKLNGTARSAQWDELGGAIQISFVPPVPGAPESLTGRTLYYRTLPEKMARTHIPAWRARGYFRITSEGEAQAKLANFHDPLELIEHSTRLERGGEEVEVRTDYLLEG